jgi:hypothetical protein
MHRSILLPIAFAFLLATASTHALEQWQVPGMSQQKASGMVWQEMRDCARAASQQVQDHTPEGDRQREALRLNCLRVHHLPVDPQPRRQYAPPS